MSDLQGPSLLGHEQRQQLESDKKYFEKQLNHPLIEDVPAVRGNLRRIEHALETQAPKRLQGQELDKVVRREKELRDMIVPNMLSQAEMRQAPPGAVGREIAFQKRFNSDIIEWKNCRRTIEYDSEDPDVANLEIHRPVVSRGNLDNAQIPGQIMSFPSAQYQEGYDGIDWSKHTRAEGEDAETFESRVRGERLSDIREKMALLEIEVEDDKPAKQRPPITAGLKE